MKLKYQTTAEQKRTAVRDYFEGITRWTSVRELSRHLGCSAQAARYYVNHLFDRGYLESCCLKTTGTDGIERMTNHYRKRT